jgi:chromosome segregation ATPase
MISKVFSGLTIVIAGAAAFFGMQGKEAVGKLQGALSDTKSKLASEVSAHMKTKTERDALKAELETTKGDLEAMKGKLAESVAALDAKAKEADMAKAALAMKEAELADLRSKLPDPTVNPEELKRKIEEMVAKIKDPRRKSGFSRRRKSSCRIPSPALKAL